MSDSGQPDSVVTSEEEGGLTEPPSLIKVDRYGSVSGLVRVRVPLGMLVIVPKGPLVFDEGCE